MQAKFEERRSAPRTELSQLVRIRPFDPIFPAEYCTTFNISWNGVYCGTRAVHYFPGMNLYVTCDFVLGGPMNRQEMGTVVRVNKLEDGGFGVAIRFLRAA